MSFCRLARSGRFVALCALALSASEALAFFDAQVLAGKRWYNFEGKDAATDKTETMPVQSTEISVAAHLSPIPLVPVSFGALINVGTLRTDDLDAGSGMIDTAAVFQAALDIQAWVPLIPMLTPYARLSIPVYGNIAVKGKNEFAVAGVSQKIDFASKSSLTGIQLGVGAKFSFLPLVSILLEVGMGMEKQKLEESTTDGKKNDNIDKDAYKADSKSFKLGVEVGI